MTLLKRSYMYRPHWVALAVSRDVPEGIRRGLLSTFRYFGVPDEVDYSNIPWRSSRFEGLGSADGEVAAALKQLAFQCVAQFKSRLTNTGKNQSGKEVTYELQAVEILQSLLRCSVCSSKRMTPAATSLEEIDSLCTQCSHRICGRCPGAIEAIEIHGGILGLYALPIIQGTDYGTCGTRMLFHRSDRPGSSH